MTGHHDHLDAHEAAEQLSPAAARCRDLGHSWQPMTARRFVGGFSRVLRCRSCKTRRIEDYDMAGYLVSRRYEYPETGYRLTGIGYITTDYRAAFRVRSLSMMSGDEAEED